MSGGHINPAVTAGLAAAGRVKPARAVLYVIAQCAGAAAGSGLLKAFTPDRAAGSLGVTGLGTDVTPLQGFGIEFFLGFVLVFVVCGVSCNSFTENIDLIISQMNTSIRYFWGAPKFLAIAKTIFYT